MGNINTEYDGKNAMLSEEQLEWVSGGQDEPAGRAIGNDVQEGENTVNTETSSGDENSRFTPNEK